MGGSEVSERWTSKLRRAAVTDCATLSCALAAEHDARGWFQWYYRVRPRLVTSRRLSNPLKKEHSHRPVSPPSKRLSQFFLGRRCEDDDRQVGRWDRVAGEASGRWRRILLQKYRQKGVCESSFPPTGPTWL